MPLCYNVTDLIKELSKSEGRSLIMIDHILKDPASWCLFDEAYDVNVAMISQQQFSAAKAQLGSASANIVYTKLEFPILEHIGNWKVTVITRSKDGTIVCENGESSPTALLIGLE